METEAYLDANAGARLRPESRAAVLEALDALPGNPASAHAAGRRVRRILADARERVAALVGARPQEIVFTSGATESNRLALRGALAAAPRAARRLVTSRAEHPSVARLADRLADEGVPVTRVGVDPAGRVSAADVAAAVPPEGAVVSIVLAQPVTGALEPVADAAARVRGRAVAFHTDAAQAVGRVPVHVGELGADYVAFSAHKLGGPPGIGALWIREGAAFVAPDGLASQELGRRGGTEAAPLAAGFGAAAAAAAADLAAFGTRAQELLAPLRALIAALPGARILTPPTDALPNTCLFAVHGIDGTTLLAALDARGVRVATGTACTSGARTPAEVLVAGGRSPEEAARAVRVSVAWNTSAADVAQLVAALPDVVRRASDGWTST